MSSQRKLLTKLFRSPVFLPFKDNKPTFKHAPFRRLRKTRPSSPKKPTSKPTKQRSKLLSLKKGWVATKSSNCHTRFDKCGKPYVLAKETKRCRIDCKKRAKSYTATSKSGHTVRHVGRCTKLAHRC